MATLADLTARASGPGRGLLRLGGRAGRRTQLELSARARWATLSTLDLALLVADAALTSALAREALLRILGSPLADDTRARLVAQTRDSADLERLVTQALDSPEAARLATRVIDSRLIDVVIERLLASEGLWLLVDEVAQSPAVTAAISHQGVGFASQMAGVVRERSRHADDRLERIAARVTRRAPRSTDHPEDNPAPGP